MGTNAQQFCLKWNNHQANMLSVFDRLLSSKSLVDVTIGCEGKQVKAHKVVLSACSPFFESLFTENPCKHPIVILKDIRYADLKALVEFMYKGEVNVVQEQLPTLLKTAEALKIKGLAEVTGDKGDSSDKPNACVTQRPDSPSRRKRQRVRRKSTDSAGGHSDSEESVPKASRTEATHDDSSMDGATSLDDGSQASLQHAAHKDASSSNVQNQSSNVNNSSSSGDRGAAGDKANASSEKASHNSSSTNGTTNGPSGNKDNDFEPTRLLEASMTTDHGADNSQHDMTTTGPDNSLIPDGLDIKPIITLEEGATPTGAIVPASGPPSLPTGTDAALSSLFPSGTGATALPGTSYQASPQSHDCSPSSTSAITPLSESRELAAFSSKQLLMNCSTAAGNIPLCGDVLSSPSPSPGPITPSSSSIVGSTISTPGIPAGNNAIAPNSRPSEACIPCEICGRRFRSLADVRSHVAAIHLKNSEDPERRFQCEFCPFRAYTKTSIRQHMFLHTGEVPYKCELCSYGARQKFHLDRHRQKAHGIVPTPKRSRYPSKSGSSGELSIIPVFQDGPEDSTPSSTGNGNSNNGHLSDSELPLPSVPPVFPPNAAAAAAFPQIFDPATLKLASNLFQLMNNPTSTPTGATTNGTSATISSTSNGGAGKNASGSSASTSSDQSSQENDS